ncbi:hypothetical protein Pmani_039133 [Petrolisthes manimaculis]|uniref:Uncharacterized protein n=1 Tax=Petrolisthes manimaculis TaxID=1843537 RepID=A0AAE1NDE9_9EUCA|nr:hypothetical protein Pmani_039133 [Petrolisthes manimaculis]
MGEVSGQGTEIETGERWLDAGNVPSFFMFKVHGLSLMNEFHPLCLWENKIDSRVPKLIEFGEDSIFLFRQDRRGKELHSFQQVGLSPGPSTQTFGGGATLNPDSDKTVGACGQTPGVSTDHFTISYPTAGGGRWARRGVTSGQGAGMRWSCRGIYPSGLLDHIH